MIEKLQREYARLEKTIKTLKWFLIFLIFVVIYTELSKYDLCLFPFSLACVGNFFEHIAEITKSLITLFAALLATLVADRHITHSTINLVNEERAEIVQITHRYIAVAKDLKANVSFIKDMFAQGGFTISALIVVADTIEKRYETLFEKEAYKYLPGSAVDLINDMSGSIAGIKMIIANIKNLLLAKLLNRFFCHQ